MANQEDSYTGNQGSGTDNAFFDFTFPTFSESEIKVEVDDVVKTLTTHYTVENYNATSGGKVKFTTNNIPTGTTPVRIFRQTNVDSAKAVFTAGSSLKAGEINNNFTQVLRGLQEAIGANATDRKVQNFNIADHAITSVKIKDATIVEADLANSAVTQNKLADNSVGTPEIINGAVTRVKLEADIIDGTKLADNAVDSEHYTDGSINHEHLNGDCVDGDNIQDNAINSEHYVDGSIDRIHLEADIIDGSKIEDDAVGTEHIAADGVRTGNIQNDAVTIDKIADAVIVTNSEQAAHSVDDSTFFTTAAAEARYFNASTSETIKDGQNFPDNDTSIATTAAINDRIIDLVDGVGGFVPVPNETSFPAANPDINNPPAGGTIVSIKAASEALPNGSTATLNGTTLTISNGRGTNSAVILTGAPSTIPSGFGFLVETTSTDHTYAFHRLVPKATEVTTVAGKATEIGRLGTADAVADMAILGTADVVSDLNTLGTADVVSDMNALAVSDVISDMNTLAVTSVINNMDTVATNVANVNLTGGSIGNVNTTATNIANVNTTATNIGNVNTVGAAISNVNTTATNIASVNTTASNINNVNNFADRYQIASNNPSTDGGGNALVSGDLYFNTSANELKVYNGSAWQAGVTATGNFALTTGNTFTGDNRYNDGVKALFGSGSDLQIYHNGTQSFIDNNIGHLVIRNNVASDVGGNIYLKPHDDEQGIVINNDGAVELYYDNSKKLETTATGILLEDSSAKTTAPLQIKNVNSSGVNTNAKLEFYGRTVIGQGSIPYIQSVHGTEAGGINTANDGGLEFHTRNGGTGTDTMCMHMAHDAKVGIRTTSPAHTLDVNGDVQIQSTHARLFLTDTNHNPDWSVENENGIFRIKDQTANSSRLTIDSGGQVNVTNKVFLNGGLDTDGDVQFNTGTTNSNILFDASAGALEFTDGNKAVFGTDNDLSIYHDATANINKIHSQKSNEIKVKNYYVYTNQHGTAQQAIMAYANAQVELMHQGTKKFETQSAGVNVEGQIVIDHTGGTDGKGEITFGESGRPFINGFDNGNHGSNAGFDFRAGNGDYFIKTRQDAAVDLYYDNGIRFSTKSNGFEAFGGQFLLYGPEGGESQILMYADEGDDVNDRWRLMAGTDNTWILGNLSDGSWDNSIKAVGSGAVTLYHDDSAKLATTTNGIDVTGRVVCDRIDIDGQLHLQYGSSTNTNYMATLQNNNGIMHIFRGDALYIGNNMNTSNQGSGPNNKAISLKTNGDIVATGNCTASAFYGDGSNLTGITSVGGSTGADFNDNVALRFGTSNDATIKHDAYSSLQISYSSADTSISSQTPAGIRILNTSNTDNGLNGIYFAGGGHQANVGIFAKQKDNATASTGQGCDLWFYTKRNGQSIMGERARFTNYGHFIPATNDTYDLGDSSIRWRNIYTNDLHLSNEGGANDVDSTWGNWTIQEGESDLFLKNNRSGKKYKFNLTEVS